MLSKRWLSAVLLALSMVAFPAGVGQAASEGSVECGFFEYVAPDADNPGSIEFGASAAAGLSGDLFVIAAGAPVPANISELSGAPTCLSLTLESGVITEMHYAASGSVSGAVAVYGDPENDPENSVYITAGRVATPYAVAATEPGLWAILGNAAATGANATLHLNINLEFGFPQSFTAATSVSGTVVMSETNIAVGLGTLPEEVIDAASRALLQEAANLGADAKVIITSQGEIDVNTGALNVTTTLEVTFANPEGSIGGPCGASYYGVFDNTGSNVAIRFRLIWGNTHGVHVRTKWVAAGSIYRTWEHWAKPKSLVRVSYKNPDTRLWVRLASLVAGHGGFPPCVYQRGYETLDN
ncbi:MAG: hypothetical protein ABI744_04740 [Chloroflexota bacterium]